MIEKRVGVQNDCAREGLSTCKKIKDSGLHGEAFPLGSSESHTDRGRVIRVRPELVITSFKV